MRWRRSLRRLLVALLFLCMTIKIRLELRLLESSPNSADISVNNKTRVRENASDGRFSGSSLYAVREKSLLSVAPRLNASLNEASKDGKKIGNTSRNSSHTPKGIFAKLGILVGSKERTDNMKASAKAKEFNTKESQPKSDDHGGALKGNPDRAAQDPVIKSGPTKAKESPPPSPNKSKLVKAKEIAALLQHGHRFPVQKKLAGPYGIPKKGVSHDVDSSEVSLTKEAIAKIKKQLEVENELQKVYNEEHYGHFLSNTSILLVQVHNRLENLRYLVESMKRVRGIKEALVIFSHDLWDPAINAFVRNITEFRVMQIFFPFSIQLHPFSFPGRDPRDCSWNVNRRESMECLNSQWPDSYGHYREAAFTQIKHHWWWKIHRVFEGLRVTRTNYSGHVVFLEEDHYVSPDLLHVLRLLQRSRGTMCPTCQVLALGNYNKLSTTVYKNFVERGDWWVTKHNLGFALDVSAWRTLATCKDYFCDYDDYNWDWTLNTLVQTCLKPRMSMLSIRFSRVVHVGSCGTHVKKKSCDVRKEVQSAVNRFSSGRQWLFQQSLRQQNLYRSSGKPKKGNGGWGDFRDKQLCVAIGNSTASEDTISRLQFPSRS